MLVYIQVLGHKYVLNSSQISFNPLPKLTYPYDTNRNIFILEEINCIVLIGVKQKTS